MVVNVVWFKRDIRLLDHEPLAAALEQNIPLLLVYCFEPSLMAAPFSDTRHWRFVLESIQDLNHRLKEYSTQVYIFHSEIEQVFARLHETHELNAVFSHQETGNAITYERDLKMANWFKKRKISWHEYQTNGVQRGLKNRATWAQDFEKRMSSIEIQPPIHKINSPSLSNRWANAWKSSLPTTIQEHDPNFQKGGESMAWRYLRSFFSQRFQQYSKGISKPELSRKTCSRLSPYLAWGCLSMRSLFHETHEALLKGVAKRALYNLRSRLYWHCHFIQKFEMEDRMEFENVNRGFNQLHKPVNGAFIRAWENGKTGYPLVDACMRCVKKTGYLNFRMRAMVTSFLTQNLWQPWQTCASFLARQFLDFEPGIHYPQLQMQAGMTGTNTFRIYNVVKQAEDHDPEALFIKRWLPELAKLPPSFALAPWEMTVLDQTMYGFTIGVDYPHRIVNHEETARKARVELGKVMKTSSAKLESKRILKKHVKLSDKKAHRSQADQDLKRRLEESD